MGKTEREWVHFRTGVPPHAWSVGPYTLEEAKRARSHVERRGGHSAWVGAPAMHRTVLKRGALDTAFTQRPALPADEVIFTAAVRYAMGRRGPSVDHITKWAMEQLPKLRLEVIDSMVQEIEMYLQRQLVERSDCWGRLLVEARGYI